MQANGTMHYHKKIAKIVLVLKIIIDKFRTCQKQLIDRKKCRLRGEVQG